MGNCKIYQLVLGPIQTNCYVAVNPEEKAAVVIDPADRGDYIKKCLDDLQVTLKGILLTHGHFDHIEGVRELKESTGAPLYALEQEKDTLSDPKINLAAMYGKNISLQADEYLSDGQSLTVGGMTFQVIWTPGHTAGGTCYYLASDGVLFAGDTLFHESIGRTDFPGGDAETLLRAVREKLFVLPDDTAVCTGHGIGTTIGHEKTHNPYLR